MSIILIMKFYCSHTEPQGENATPARCGNIFELGIPIAVESFPITIPLLIPHAPLGWHVAGEHAFCPSHAPRIIAPPSGLSIIQGGRGNGGKPPLAS